MAQSQKKARAIGYAELSDLTADESFILDYVLEHGQVTSRQLERRLRVRLGISKVRSALESLQARGALVSLGQTSGSTYSRRSSWLELQRGVREELERAERLRLQEGPRIRPSALAAG